ncbi:TPA: hypothetical protein DDW35_08015 [Candidatus Sumerlaeota bacterium]|jgi:hypothetical protein|nr:hypothetical protein [Candidatus Sumerlaeota bacterium]
MIARAVKSAFQEGKEENIRMLEHIHIIIYLIAAALVAATVARLLRDKKRRAAAPPPAQSAKPALLNFTAAVCVAVSILGTAGLFFQGQALIALRVLACVIFALSAMDAGVAIRRWYENILEKPTVRRSEFILPGVAALIGFLALEFTVSLCGIPGGKDSALAVDYPVHGEWKVVTGGPTALTNYHHNNPVAQNSAVDMVRSQGASEGETIYAPIDGVVSKAVGDRSPGGAEPEGNIVIIKDAKGIEIWLAHLQQNSLLVQAGDSVKRGQALAKCGATGSADVAHLHIHAQKDNQPVPLLFGPAKKFLLRNALFQTTP